MPNLPSQHPLSFRLGLVALRELALPPLLKTNWVASIATQLASLRSFSFPTALTSAAFDNVVAGWSVVLLPLRCLFGDVGELSTDARPSTTGFFYRYIYL